MVYKDQTRLLTRVPRLADAEENDCPPPPPLLLEGGTGRARTPQPSQVSPDLFRAPAWLSAIWLGAENIKVGSRIFLVTNRVFFDEMSLGLSLWPSDFLGHGAIVGKQARAPDGYAPPPPRCWVHSTGRLKRCCPKRPGLPGMGNSLGASHQPRCF